MKKTTIIWIIVAVVIIGSYTTIKGSYNGFVTKDESVKMAWGQVENQYQRRFDLIPNLVSTVKGYAEHEGDTFKAITEARSKIGQTSIDINNAEELAQFQNAQQGLGSALSRLMVVMENYPDLKANQNFLDLQTQLEGTENRISTERMRFNKAVKSYNVAIRKFPSNIFAGIFGFEKANLFESTTGAEVAPSVEF
jgi:LemA protein